MTPLSIGKSDRLISVRVLPSRVHPAWNTKTASPVRPAAARIGNVLNQLQPFTTVYLLCTDGWNTVHRDLRFSGEPRTALPSTMNSMHPYFLQLALLGLGAGFMAGLLGIGGGMVIVPFLTLILATQGISPDLTIKMAIATSMAVIMFTSLSSVRAHHKRGAVLWDLVRRLTPGIVLGSLVSSLGVFAYLKGSALAIAFGVFVAFSATQMFVDRKPQPNREMPGTTGTIAAGGTIGFVSGLVGAGGGFITVPFMTWCNVAIHNAVATSAALGFPIAAANVAGYVVSGWSTTGLPTGSIGYMWLPGVVVVASGSMLTAPIGARMAHALPVTLLKKLFGVVLYALAGYMLHKGLTN